MNGPDRPDFLDELRARTEQPKRAFRAYDDNRALFVAYARDEQQALEAAMERCLDDGIGYLDKLHVCELVRR